MGSSQQQQHQEKGARRELRSDRWWKKLSTFPHAIEQQYRVALENEAVGVLNLNFF